jgi:diacylglycerol kinase
MPNPLRGLTHSFRAAARGIFVAFKSERTFRVMVAMGLLMLALIAVLPLAAWERVLLLLLTGAILVLELVNSMVERLVDLLKPRLSAYVGEVKDLMAGAVLMASLFAAVLALLILLPHLPTLLQQL